MVFAPELRSLGRGQRVLQTTFFALHWGLSHGWLPLTLTRIQFSGLVCFPRFIIFNFLRAATLFSKLVWPHLWPWLLQKLHCSLVLETPLLPCTFVILICLHFKTDRKVDGMDDIQSLQLTSFKSNPFLSPVYVRGRIKACIMSHSG